MKKYSLILLLILIMGCQSLPTGEVTHSWLFVDDGQYNVEDNQFNITVVYDEQQRYYRVGAHDSWGTKQLESRLIDVSVMLDDDINKITVDADFQQDSASGLTVPKHSSSKDICANQKGLALNQLPENQETYQYHMTVCFDSLVVTDKTEDAQCVIDLVALNKDFIQLDASNAKPLATYFNYSLQDKDGSVLLWKHNYGDFSGKDSIDIYHPSCSHSSDKIATHNNRTHKKTVSIKELGPRLSLSMSHYGTPTILANNNNQNYQRIISLSGDVLRDQLQRNNKGWKTLFLPDEHLLYEFDIEYGDDFNKAGKELQFDLIITRYNYAKNNVEVRRITVEQPSFNQ
ncbi:hypothetical protein [Kangiella sediminilitoris]|uniref:Lipoprotein n=1 Tax=Kangiella sediminilitoris TaxID=1144748 RepID=A0A1B3B9W5_9GAMM|nr:hypothetical protein [Kangiella sediminilitoris]AOE49591.1 hypothetical protein KS2013_869 [Kangiella sediminilitoris]